ncbi:hypothetical protein Mal4_50750 [Maioricimonas rarisocia]|uniref:SPOR domain-containing protein n=1 Tax=Maioricimonas rarisocia TaxID=2528026 RepID=A0A517ZE36_9PLAN|nr:hypothetical protein [Maioricimonas rarisocia]QDU40715.1 hypothetical protein Mal4_50750 [Maioricimonas rarisocia]
MLISSSTAIAKKALNATSKRRWQLAGRFETYEQAEQCVRDLTSRGIKCSLSLVGGLSVLAMR